MKVAIMQPYFFPYIGYFQLINAVDTFVIYDDIEYVKQSWMNRNRILLNGQPSYISLPLKKDSDYLHVKQRELAGTWLKEHKKLISKLRGAYNKAPFFAETMQLIEPCINSDNTNLFTFLLESIENTLKHLGITTKVIISSSLGDFTHLRSQDKVIAICRATSASHYINPIGGTQLYDSNSFDTNNLKLSFLKTRDFNYPQYNNDFQAFLSIIDVLMFNGKAQTRNLIEQNFDLLNNDNYEAAN